jgi:circadian clock protein KaiB
MVKGSVIGADEKCSSAKVRPTESNKIEFRLYIAKGQKSSVVALSNLRTICREFLDGNYDIEVVDTLSHTRRAQRDGIAATPTLVKVSPEPGWSIVGDLSEDALILAIMQGKRPKRSGG